MVLFLVEYDEYFSVITIKKDFIITKMHKDLFIHTFTKFQDLLLLCVDLFRLTKRLSHLN